MKKFGFVIFILLTCILILFPVDEARSTIINAGFETGDLSGWNTTIPSGATAEAVKNHTGDLGRVYAPPPEGDYFAKLKTDGGGHYTTISQQLMLSDGETISGWAAFDARDWGSPWNDNAWVKIFDISGTSELAQPWYSDISIVGMKGDGPWTSWAWTATDAGVYTLTFGIANSYDPNLDSYALFDHVQGGNPVSTPVPEPGTLISLSIGLLGLFCLKSSLARQEKS